MLKSKNRLLHKAFAFVLTFSLLATLVSFNFTASAADSSQEITINNVDDLKNFAASVNNGSYTNVSVTLNNDITISDAWTPIGNKTNKFTGVFDGGSHTINLNGGITDGDYVGLFGINDGTIKNVTVSSTATINSTTVKAFVGGIVGLNRGTISNCTNSANISTTGVDSYAGGIAGVMQNGTIDTCTNSGTITVTITDNSSTDVKEHEASAGGIVGFNYNGTVQKSTNTETGSISNNETYGYTGGIVGNNDGVIDNCLNKGTVSNTNTTYVGGIAGNLFTNSDTGSTAKISNSLTTADDLTVFGANGIEIKAETKGIVTNCYYKYDTSTEETDGIKGVTQEELSNGTVTYMLNGNSSANPVWGQSLTLTNTLPMIGADENSTVYPNTDTGTSGEKLYVNEKPNNCTHEYENGACKICGDIIAKVSGYSVTLDGYTGLNFYFDIKGSIDTTNASVAFTRNGESAGQITLTKETNNTENLADGYTRYSARINMDSDQMNIPVSATLSGITAEDNTTDITVKSEEYTIDKYLNSLSSRGDSKLTKLAVAMSTYGYYSNEYFDLYPSYTPSVSMGELTISPDALNSYELTYSDDNESNTLKHYASSFQHLQTVAGVFYVQEKTNLTVPESTVMGYKIKLSDNKYLQGNNDSYAIAEVVSGATGYNWAVTAQIPVSELRNATFEVTFGSMDGEAYTPNSNIKYYSPYCYIKQVLATYETTSIDYKLAQALYHYSEAAADYQNP